MELQINPTGMVTQLKREVNPTGTNLDKAGLKRERQRESKRERERDGKVELVDTFAPRLPPLPRGVA